MFADFENTFSIRYPNANAPTEIMAIAASPFIFVFCPVFNNKIADIIVTGKIKIILFVRLNIVDTAIAPKATWESPSPINEKRFNTNVTPRSDEQRAISVPTINA